MSHRAVLILALFAICGAWLSSVAHNPYLDFVTPKCIANPAECAASELCLIAAVGEAGSKIWSNSTERQAHVLQAQRLNLQCGVL
jgi:hypothetical protein